VCIKGLTLIDAGFRHREAAVFEAIRGLAFPEQMGRDIVCLTCVGEV
jgi:hypothetical protein